MSFAKTPSNTSSNSMNIYELVEPTKENGEDLISEDQDRMEEGEDEIESENDENVENEQIYTDEDENENETSEDLSSGGAASSGGSGINEPNVGSLANNKNQFSRRLRTLNNRRNNSLLVKNKKKKKNMKLNLSLSTPNKANGNSKSNLLNGSLNKSNLKRTNMLLKSAKSPNGIANGNKIISKKLKLLEMQRNGHQRSERLCSMPGYNLLSENEKKVLKKI